MKFYEAVIGAYAERSGRLIEIFTEPKTSVNYGLSARLRGCVNYGLAGIKRYVVGQDVMAREPGAYFFCEDDDGHVCTFAKCNQVTSEPYAPIYSDTASEWRLIVPSAA